jgi:tape measure domain-containing protein
MANTTRRDVELRINANDLSEKTLQQLLDTFEKLRASQEALAKSGDGTQRSVRELKQDLVDLQAVAVELKSRAALVDQFVAIEKRAADAATRVEAAKAALLKFNAAQAEGTELTKKEQTEFNRLSREVGKAETSLTTSTAKLQQFNVALAQIGAADTSTTREALLRFSADLGTSLAAAEQSIRHYDEALRANALNEEAATKAKRKAAVAATELKTAQDALSAGVVFNTQGRDALKAASSVEVLTRDYDKLTASSRKAGDGIRDILDPTRQALTSLNGLEAEVKRLNGQLDTVQTGPKLGEELKQIRAEYNAFAADAGRAAASLVDDIGSYRKVEASLAALRTRVDGAQQSVREFAAQMAVASVPSETLARDLASAQAKLKGFVGEFDREAQGLANLRARLREAGVDVNALADAETRLAGVAGGVVESQRKIEAVAGRVAQLAQATQDLKAAEEALKGGVAFNQLGRDALKAAGGVDALSRDYDALAVSSRKAGDAIRGIIDPSRGALASLDGLEAQTQKLNEQLEKAQSSTALREEVRKLRSEYASLASDAGKAAAGLVDDIGSYRQAEQAVGTLRVRVEEAQQSVRKFAGQMAVAASPSEALVKSLAAAKTQLNSLVNDFDRQSTALAKLRAELREAGVNTDKLSEAEGRLAQVAHGVVTAQEALGVAAVKVGKGSGEASKGLGLFEDTGRKALSTAQRLRGELLSLASSYLGLFAAVNVAEGAIEASVSREQILRRLELIEGSAEKATAKFKQLRATADLIGVDFQKSADGFTSIAIGAKEAGVSGERLDRFYVNLSKTVRGLSLDGEKTARVFLAVSQVFGKNKLQSEELVQQLGEHLPGVVAIAQKALNLTATEFTKALQEGRLGAESLIVIFQEYAKRVDALSKNDNSVIDSLTRFRNALFDLKLAIADSGFLDTFIKLLKDATAAVKSGELNDAIAGLGSLLRLAGEAARFLLEHITGVEVVIGALVSWNVGKLLLSVAFGLKALTVNSGLAAGAVRLLGAAFAFLIANPIVALIVLLITLVASTEKGRAAFRALWQITVELGNVIADLLNLNFAGFATRVKASMDRVSAAFRGAKKDAEDLRDTGTAKKETAPPPRDLPLEFANSVKANLAKRGITATVTDERTDIPRSNAAATAAIEFEEKRRAEAALTQKTVEVIEQHMADVRKAAATEAAKSVHDIEGQVRAEYQDTQIQIDDLNKRAVKTKDAATAAAAKALQAKFDKEIAIIVAAKKKEAAELESKKFAKGGIADELEQSKLKAEAVKDGLRIEQAELEQSFKEGLVSLRDYYAKRLDETNRGLDAEITAAREQIATWEKVRRTDPNAAKNITKLEGQIAGATSDKALAERKFRLEAELAEKALRRQVDAVQTELEGLTGDERQAGLRAIQQFYIDQLEQVNKLTGAEKERALATLQTLVDLRAQLVEINLMAKAADQMNAMREAKIGAAVTTGDLSHMQELNARSASNKLYLADLQKQAEQLEAVGMKGTDAYKAIQVQIIKLKGETDLLGNEITATVKTAATSLVETLIQTKSPQKAMKAFGKSLGSALSKAFIDEAASAIVKWLKESGGFDTIKSLFTGITKLFATGHTGAVIGYGGASKAVSPFAFLGAPRYHSGGLPGLRRDEVAFIGLKGEEVLARNDPRNVMNAGKNPAGSGGGPLIVQLHPDAMHMTLRDWLQGELARVSATQ